MSRNLFIYTLYAVAMAILQATLMPHLALLHAPVDLQAILLAFLAVMIGRNGAMGFGFLGGMVAGLLSGEMGLQMLAGTLAGFVAGWFHIPEGSHATPVQKARKFIEATAAACLVASVVMLLGNNPLGLSPAWRLLVIAPLSTLLTLLPAFVASRFFIGSAFSD